MNGLKYDLKSNFIKKTDFFQITENVMNFYGFKDSGTSRPITNSAHDKLGS